MAAPNESAEKPRPVISRILRAILRSIVNGSAVLGILATLILLVGGKDMQVGDILVILGQGAIYVLLVIVPLLPFLMFGAMLEDEPVIGYISIIIILGIYLWIGSSMGCVRFEQNFWDRVPHLDPVTQLPLPQDHILRLRYPRLAFSELVGYPLELILSLSGWLFGGNLHAFLQEHYPNLLNRVAILVAFLCGNLVHRYVKPYISDTPEPVGAASPSSLERDSI